ncbi:MAG: hypothetical protein V4709_03390 [Pseudomonadota bacterium]
MIRSQSRELLTLLGLLALVLGIYLQGLFGGFMFDDASNIVDNEFLRRVGGSWESWKNASFSSTAGFLKRPVSMFTFALNAYWSGMDPVAFKLVNIVIHLINGVLAYQIALRLLPALASRSGMTLDLPFRHGLALFAAALWLLHPLHVSNVLYVVQRMNLLAVLFTLAALLCYVALRQRQIAGTREHGGWLIAGLAGFTALALFSKENGALIPLFVLTIELWVFRFAAARPVHSTILRWMVGLILGLILLAVTYLLVQPEWILAGYRSRDFTLAERLLTQTRVLWHYLIWTFVPNLQWMGLHHDDIAYSRGFVTPWTTLPALVGLFALGACACLTRHTRPWIGFAVAWWIAGHAMESTVIALEMAFEHRQYLPMYGLIIGLVSGLAAALQRHPRLGLALAIAVLLALTLLTARRCWHWDDPVRLAERTAQDHPNSPRAIYDAGRLLTDEAAGHAEKAALRQTGREYLQQAMQLSPAFIHPAAALVMTYQQTGERVPAALMAELSRRAAAAPAFTLTMLPVLQVVRATASGLLLVDREQMDRLVTASIENQSLDKLSRGLILTNYGNYLISIANEPQAAIGVTLTAIELEPGYALFHLNAAYLGERLGQPELAAQHLANAELLDHFGELRLEIAALRDKLAHPKSTTSGPRP